MKKAQINQNAACRPQVYICLLEQHQANTFVLKNSKLEVFMKVPMMLC